MITRFDYTCIYPDSQEGAIAPLRTRCYEHLYLAQAAAKNNKKREKYKQTVYNAHYIFGTLQTYCK